MRLMSLCLCMVLGGTALAAEKSIYRVAVSDDNSRALAIEVGSTVDYELNLGAVAPPFARNLKVTKTGGIGEPEIARLVELKDGRPRIGTDRRSIRVTATKKGPATVTITYEKGGERFEKTLKLDVSE